MKEDKKFEAIDESLRGLIELAKIQNRMIKNLEKRIKLLEKNK